MTWSERLWGMTGLAGLAVGTALLIAARGAGPLWGEEEAMQWVQTQPGWTEAARVLRWCTATEPVTVAGLLVGIAAGRFKARRFALVTVVLFLVLPVVQSGLKELADRPRPSPPAVELRGGYSSPSFPAGHAMSGLVGYGWAAVSVNRLRRIGVRARYGVVAACAGVVAGTAWANLWTGVHWPTDIGGGFAWGLVLLALGRLAWHTQGRHAQQAAS